VKLRAPIVLGCAALVVAVAGVTILLARGGSPAPLALPTVAPARPAFALARGALALARQDGDRVVALTLQRAGGGARARVTVLGPSGGGLAGLAVTVGGVRATTCGRGCYRVLVPRVTGRVVIDTRGPGTRTTRTDFSLPRTWPVAATAVLARVERTLRASRSVAYREHLASAPGHAIDSLWRAVAPNRLAYSADNGTAGIVIGGHRWDRDSSGGAWLRSAQNPPLRLPTVPWGARVQNVVLLDPPAGKRGTEIRFALFDPATPAWYEVTVAARSDRIRSLGMTAVSHFMRDDYLGYDSAAPIRPPANVAK
jgi:hypothetical protein